VGVLCVCDSASKEDTLGARIYDNIRWALGLWQRFYFLISRERIVLNLKGQNTFNLLAIKVKPPSNAVTPVYTINPP
jgi:hypothetical protein